MLMMPAAAFFATAAPYLALLLVLLGLWLGYSALVDRVRGVPYAPGVYFVSIFLSREKMIDYLL